jgi:recombination protein RecT
VSRLRQALAESQQTQQLEKAGNFATLKGFFEKNKSQFTNQLPAHLKAERIIELTLTAFQQTPQLWDCDPKSIFGATLTAAKLGLEIGVLGQGFLVPYKKQATFIPGWQGLTDLVSRGGRASLWTGAVYEGDDFDFQLGDSPFCRHRPRGEDDINKLLYVYACGRVKDGDYPIIEVWSAKKVWKHRDVAAAKLGDNAAKHYSFTHPEMYARKLPLLQVVKYLPKSIELAAAVQLANVEDGGRGATMSGEFIVTEITSDEPPAPPADPLAGIEVKEDLVIIDAEQTPASAEEKGLHAEWIGSPPGTVAPPQVTMSKVIDAILKAKTTEALDLVRTELVPQLGVLNESGKAAIDSRIASRLKEIEGNG